MWGLDQKAPISIAPQGNKVSCSELRSHGSGEMVQLLRARSALLEDQSSSLSTHGSNPRITPVPRIRLYFGLQGFLYATTSISPPQEPFPQKLYFFVHSQLYQWPKLVDMGLESILRMLRYFKVQWLNFTNKKLRLLAPYLGNMYKVNFLAHFG